MNRFPFRSLLCALALTLFAPGAASAVESPETEALLSDPEWRKRFLGSYGFLSGAEPQVQPTELEVLREVIDLMKVNLDAAAARLEGLSNDSSSAALDFILANLRFQNGDLGAARATYDRAIGKFPDFRRAHKNLGLLLVQEQAFAAAARHLGRAVELGDRDGRSYGLLGYCYVNLENHLAAEQAYRNAILAEPDTRDWKLGLARSLLAMEKYSEAIALFDQLLAEKPDDTTTWMLQANAFVGLEQPRRAAVNLEAVRALGQAQTRSLQLLGDIYMNEGMYDLARGAYMDVIEADAGAADFQTAKRAAELLVRAGAFTQAEKLLASIDERYRGKLDRDQELERLTLQARVARARGRDQEAARLLESIVDRDGTRGDALLELAAYHRDQGNRAKAELLIERASNLEAFEYQALLDHAQLVLADRDYSRAAELLRRALRIKSEPRVQRFLERVEQAIRPS